VPKSIAIVAFPDAYKQSGTALPVDYDGDFFVVQADEKHIKSVSSDAQWLAIDGVERIVDGVSRVRYSALDNTLSRRSCAVQVKIGDQVYQVEFRQQPGELVQYEMVRVLNSPLNLDFLVAITFIAGLIKKIDFQPVQIIVFVIAVVAIVVLSIAIAVIRHAFADVPEPKPLSTDTNGVPIVLVPNVSISQGLPLASVAAEDQTIALQTLKEIYWLAKQSF
jgi:hypothetical protein